MLSPQKEMIEEVESINQNYSEIKNIGKNILSDPQLIPNGLHQAHNNVNNNNNMNESKTPEQI